MDMKLRHRHGAGSRQLLADCNKWRENTNKAYQPANPLPRRLTPEPKGMLLVSILVVTSLFVTLGMLALQFVITQNSASRFRVDRERAFQIAEAGVDYYRWHLAHVPGDFQDGTGAAGPYVHTYTDATGNVIGTFTLDITPPPAGSTIVTIKSTGQVTNRTTSARTVVTKEGVPSFTQWAVVANAAMRFGEGTEVFGPIHSNGGIRFDGLAHNLVTSYLQTYTDADGDRCTASSWAVHTCVNPDDPSPMTALPTRNDVFAAGRKVLADYVDFNNITTNLQTLETKASASGILLLPSGGQGYHLTFRMDGKVDMRIVNTQLTCQYNSASWRDYGYCSNDFNTSCTPNSSVCANGGTCLISSKSVGTRVSDQSTFTYQSASSLGVSLPANGIIFVQDDLWVDGVVPNGTRLTVVAAKEPLASGIANVYINKDLTYARACSNTNLACSLDSECTGGATCVNSSNGSTAVGIIAQQDVLVGYFSEDNIRIEAALIAQKGHVGRPYYGAGFTSSTSNANFQLSPTTGVCTNNTSKTCSADGDCGNFCQGNASRACTTNPECNGYCQAHTSKTCTGAADCNNYCTTDTSKTCNVTNDCRNYCQGDRTRSCTANSKCNGWCTGNHNKGCSNNSDCTGFGTCDAAAPDVGPCQTATTGPCITGDSCVSGDTCVGADTCSLSKNPAGGTTCQEYRKRSHITTFGSIATNQRYGFAWTGTNLFFCSGTQYNNSGYCDRTLNFDGSLMYAPPPDFPTTGQYTTLSWEEQ